MPKGFNITPSHSFTDTYDSIHVKLNIHSTALQQYQSGKLRARFAVIEDSIVFPYAPGSNLETTFRFLVRKLVPDTGGIVLKDNWINGENDSVSFTAKLPDNIYDLSKIAVVAFIQYDSTKYVIQSAISPSQSLTNYVMIDPYKSLIFSKISCSDTIKNIPVRVINGGTANLTSFKLIYQVDNKTPMSLIITDNMLPQESKIFYLPDIIDTNGTHTIKVTVTDPNGFPMCIDYYHCLSATTDFVINEDAHGPYIYEGFQSPVFPPHHWMLNNIQHTSQKWQKYPNPQIRSSAYLKIFHNIPAGVQNELILPIINTSGMSHLKMAFDVSNAYGELPLEHKYDTLNLLVSKDCGTTWDTVYHKFGPNLAVKEATAYPFAPLLDEDWRRDTVDLQAYANYPKVMMKFIGISGGGNNIFLTNINIGEYLGISEQQIQTGIYPNPAGDMVRVELGTLADKAEISICDLSGRVLISVKGSALSSIPINVSGLSNGVYLVKVIANGQTSVQKLIIKH